MITVSNLSMFYGNKVLFDNVSFQLNPKNRYGVVGANGSGKSTFMKLIEGQTLPEKGEINRPSKLKLGTLGQDHYKYEKERIIDTVIIGKKELWAAMHEKERILEKAEHTTEEGYRLADLEGVIAENNGYFAESDAAQILSGLGIPESQHYLPLSTLSGGYKLRVLLAQTLFSEPDCLLLDEPTNHLDIIAIAWLEVFLQDFPGIIVVISHDQYFLNNVCTHIADIDYETIKIYKGNYDKFIEAKELEKSQKEIGFARQEKKKEEMQEFIDRFKAKASTAKQAQSRIKMMEKMDDIDIKQSSRISPKFKFDIIRPSGKKVVEAQGLSKSFGEKQVLSDLSFSVERGEKLAIVGANGIGKSTLLKIILGLLPASQGKYEWGHEIKKGYFPQDHHEILKDGITPYDWLHNQAPLETIGAIRNLLGRMLFKNDDVHKSVSAISGGEAARLIFASLIVQKPNILLLDEPTNHMDLESVDALSEALVEYPGTLIFVSHYRSLVHKVATSILALKYDSYEYFQGTYKEYLEKEGEDFLSRNPVKNGNKGKKSEIKSAPVKLNPPQPQPNNPKRDLSKLERQLTESEKKISELEKDIALIAGELEDNNLYSYQNKEKLKQLLAKKEEKNSRLKESMALWEKLSAEIEIIKSDNSVSV